MSNSHSNNRKRKIESIAKLLIDTKNDNEFENALKRVRELAHKENLSLKNIMLENLNIQLTHFDDHEFDQIKYQNELLREEVRELKGHEFKILKQDYDFLKRKEKHLNEMIDKKEKIINEKIKIIDELEYKIYSQKKTKKGVEHWKESAFAFEKKSENMQKKASTLESKLELIQQMDELNDYNIEQSIKSFIDHYGLKISSNQKNWISTQTIFLSSKPYLNSNKKEISIKKFSMIFGKILGVNSVFGGDRKKYKGFLIESNNAMFVINMSSK